MSRSSATVTYRCTCEGCGAVWISDTWESYCEDCEPPEDNPEPTYRGYRDAYTGHYGVDWEAIRERVLERDDYECQSCGMTNQEHINSERLFGGGLHIHHKTPAHEFDSYDEANNLDNLVALCADCHREAENE